MTPELLSDATANAFVTERGESMDLKGLEEQLLARNAEDLRGLTSHAQYELVCSRSEQVETREELLRKLTIAKETTTPLKVLFGIDPTRPDVHWGHAVPMRMLSRFQRMGHQIIFVVGDFTAQVGDSSHRTSARTQLTSDEVEANLVSYTSQVKPFFDVDSATVVRNSAWLMDARRLFRFLGRVSVAQALQRKDFQNRMSSGLSVAEILYPALMAVDAIELKPDIQLGGYDQWLNLNLGREGMKAEGIAPQTLVTVPIIAGTDGRKMSKSFGNYVAVGEEPVAVYSKIMSIPDAQLEIWLNAFTEINAGEMEQVFAALKSGALHPMEAKKLLARVMVATVSDLKTAYESQYVFETIQQKKASLNSIGDLPIYSYSRATPVDIIAIAARISGLSKSDVRRMIDQGGVKLIDDAGRTIFQITNQATYLQEFLINDGREPIYLQVGKPGKRLPIKLVLSE